MMKSLTLRLTTIACLAFLLIMQGCTPDVQQTEVPNAVGRTESVGVTMMEGVGFDVSVTYKDSSNADKDKVTKQSLAYGSSAEPGSKIILTVGSGVRQVPVYDFIGETEDDSGELARAHELDIELSREYSDRPKGEIIEQTPSAMTNGEVTFVDVDSTVHLVISDGVEQVSIGNYVGLDHNIVKAELTALGVVPIITYGYHPTVLVDLVISHEYIGEDVNIGIDVRLSVSRGPVPVTVWQKVLDPPEGFVFDEIHLIAQTGDGGNLVVANCYTPDRKRSIIQLINLDLDGNIMWESIIDEPTLKIFAYDVKLTKDNGWIIVGKGEDSNGKLFAYVVEVNDRGTKKWSETYGGNDYTFARDIHLTPNGYAFSGATGNTGDWPQGYLTQILPEGNMIWSQPYNGSIESSKRMNDGSFIMAMRIETKMHLVKTDEAGVILWSIEYPQDKQKYTLSVQIVPGGGFITTGFISNPDGSLSASVIRTNDDGNILWTKVYDMYLSSYSFFVKVMDDGSCMVTLRVETDDGRSTRIAKIDRDGNAGWTESYGGYHSEGIHSIGSTTDGGYMFAMGDFDENYENSNILVVKMDSDGKTRPKVK